MMKKYLSLIIILFCSPFLLGTEQVNLPKDTLFIEAEGFAKKGGWLVDQQYMDQMGSPVVIAHGLGEPVEDAETTITFPKSGIYRIFVRTRNWVAPWTPNEKPGRFQLKLNGQTLGIQFGTEGNNWHWQQGGSVTIGDKLQQTLALHDLTGFDGRCDAIIFTADPNFIPPEDLKDLTPFRRRILGLTDDPCQAPTVADGPFDLVVCGGGAAGICAAVSAARLGLKVALIQNRPVLGGNNSSEIRVHLMGTTGYDPYPKLGDLIWEFDPMEIGNAQEAKYYKDGRKLNLVKAEKNIKIYLSSHVFAVEMDTKVPADSKRIKAVIIKNIESNLENRIEGRWFVDATGDGSIGFLAGAKWRMGRESKKESGEPSAPDKSDNLVMGASTQWYSVPVKKSEKERVFPKLPWAVQFSEKSIRPALDGEWDWETGLNRNQIDDAERVRDQALRGVYGHWAYMKNESSTEWRERAKNRKLGWVAYIAGKRESRRIEGDIVLCEQDIIEPKMYDDGCVMSTWSIDLHYPTKLQEKYFPGDEFRTYCIQNEIKPYLIPYRCLYAKDISNMFMVGRCISVTHIALGTIRVQRTGGMMGEVVGMAASLCKKYNTDPRGVYQKHLEDLKSLMLKGIGRNPMAPPAWVGDAKNLARQANVHVSSILKDSNYSGSYINDGIIQLGKNETRWVSSQSNGPPFAELHFDKPVTINTFRILTGQYCQVRYFAPVTDFVLQYRQNENDEWTDVKGSKTINNIQYDVCKRVESVTSRYFRLLITRTPENKARIYEWELYNVSKNQKEGLKK